MNVEKVKQILLENKINTSACLINPPICREGALCLREEPSGVWTVTLNERGEYLINDSFTSEDAACRYFLRKVLSDPTYRMDFKQADLETYDTFAKKRDEILRKYNL
jgi:hypothetical protein